MDTPELKELTSLITIRQYVIDQQANPAIDRSTVNFISGALLLLDKKILGILQGEKFKTYIDYGNVQQAKQQAAEITNIKSSLAKR